MKAPRHQRAANVLLGRIALGLLVFTVLAFGAKSLIHTEVQARFTPIVVVHAAAMIAWLGLLVSQAYLAAANRFVVHRALGRASILLVLVMLTTGVLISINIGEELGRIEVTIVNVAAFVTFVPLYILAVHYARGKRIHEHRQAMLIATLALMTPAYARVVQVLGLPDPIAIGIQPPITIAIALAYDWLVLARLTRPVLSMLAFSVTVVIVMAAGLLLLVGLPQ
ncbi:hypothetical protein ACI5KX_12770 [Erythrobacter sp. GH1-10]|uniref:hypothetical protein n=1 Tax=Erythrobacter sp. GH1-10 TaxID=3349334 RepID=UPI003877AEC9